VAAAAPPAARPEPNSEGATYKKQVHWTWKRGDRSNTTERMSEANYIPRVAFCMALSVDLAVRRATPSAGEKKLPRCAVQPFLKFKIIRLLVCIVFHSNWCQHTTGSAAETHRVVAGRRFPGSRGVQVRGLPEDSNGHFAPHRHFRAMAPLLCRPATTTRSSIILHLNDVHVLDNPRRSRFVVHHPPNHPRRLAVDSFQFRLKFRHIFFRHANHQSA
jgi:hypothetical protein